MYKKIIKLFVFYIFVTHSIFSFADSSKIKMPIKINFIWLTEKSQDPHHTHFNKDIKINKIVFLNPHDQHYKIAATYSVLQENLPITLVILVKPLAIDSEKIDLQFEVLTYGFSQNGTIWSQPRIILKNGQTSLISFSNQRLQASAKWS